MNEFEIIRTFFSHSVVHRDDVPLGIGDDAAVLQPESGRQLVVTADLLVEGRHFAADTPPAAVGHKALAVNLSDLAAMGAEPAWFTLSLSLPRAERAWLQDFVRGMDALAAEYQVQLVGGDTVRGPRVVAVQALGRVAPDRALRRDGARPGDRIYVTGTLGDAALALWHQQGRIRLGEAHRPWLMARLQVPQPRVRAGLALAGLASSAIDISDGLAADLGHVLAASGCGARIELARLPLSAAFRAQEVPDPWEAVLAHGDDYELCFTVPPERQADLEQVLAAMDCGCTCIGEMEAEPGLRLLQADGTPLILPHAGHDHFAGGS